MSPTSILAGFYVPHLRQNPNPLYCPHIPFRIISISFLAYRKLETPLLLAISNFSFLFSLELWVIKTSPFLLQQNCLHNRVQRSPNYCFKWSAPIGGLGWNGAVNIYCPWPTKQYLPSIFVLMKSLLDVVFLHVSFGALIKSHKFTSRSLHFQIKLAKLFLGLIYSTTINTVKH